MRILHVAPYFYPAWLYGGVVHSLWGLARAQAAAGDAVRVLTTDVLDETRRDTGPRRRTEAGVEAFYMPNVSNRAAQRAQLYFPRSGWGVARDWLAWADIVHFHCHRILFFHPLKAFLGGKPYVLSPRGSAPRVEGRMLRKHLYDLLAGDAFLRGAARLLALSDSERAGLLDRGADPARVRVIPHGIDWPNPLTLSLSKGEPPVVRQAHHERPAEVLYLGKVTPLKGIEDLFEALVRVPEARLVVAGNDNGGYARILRKKAGALGVAPRVLFAGFLEGEEKASALARASAVVVPSHYDAFGLVPLEALAAGTPVVVSRAAGCARLLDGTEGVFPVDARDPAALAEALQAALAHPVRGAVLASRAREKLEGDFGWPAIAACYAVVYREVAP